MTDDYGNESHEEKLRPTPGVKKAYSKEGTASGDVGGEPLHGPPKMRTSRNCGINM